MSKILELAQDFEQKSKQQAHDTETRLRREFERHEQCIVEALRSSEQKITSDISVQNRRMSGLVLQSWLWVVLTILLVLVACTGVIWWQGNTMLANQQEIARQSATIAALTAKGGNLQLAQCGERVCFAVAKDTARWERRSDKRSMYIPEGY